MQTPPPHETVSRVRIAPRSGRFKLAIDGHDGQQVYGQLASIITAPRAHSGSL